MAISLNSVKETVVASVCILNGRAGGRESGVREWDRHTDKKEFIQNSFEIFPCVCT